MRRDKKSPDAKPVLLRHPNIFSNFTYLIAAESTRHGGVSKPPYESLNLGIHTADHPETISENRHRFFAACGFAPQQTAGSHQIHGSAVLPVKRAGYFKGYDALITNLPQILLTVTIADCTPILLFDPVRKAVAAIHAGWKGTAAGIASKALIAMQKAYGTQAADYLAYIGTCIDYCDFEVDADVANHFSSAHQHWDEQKAKFFVNLKAANLDQLLEAGLPADQIEQSPFSTFSCTEDYFSHRKEKGITGRMLAAIGLRS